MFKHGEKREAKKSMGAGAQISIKPERFCKYHDQWIGEFEFLRDHRNCGISENGAGLGLPREAKVMRQTA